MTDTKGIRIHQIDEVFQNIQKILVNLLTCSSFGKMDEEEKEISFVRIKIFYQVFHQKKTFFFLEMIYDQFTHFLDHEARQKFRMSVYGKNMLQRVHKLCDIVQEISNELACTL
jgi:hypothetical protein